MISENIAGSILATFGGQANVTVSRLIRRANHVDFTGDILNIHRLIKEIMVWYRER